MKHGGERDIEVKRVRFETGIEQSALVAAPDSLLGRIISAMRPGAEAGACAGAGERGYDGGWHVPSPDSAKSPLAARNAGEALRLNVRDSDATLVVVIGGRDDGDAHLAARMARHAGKPCMTLALPERSLKLSPETIAALHGWCARFEVRTLHVSGQNEERAPGIQAMTAAAIAALIAFVPYDLPLPGGPA